MASSVKPAPARDAGRVPRLLARVPLARLLPWLLLLLPLLYVATLAQSLVLGDPTEYTLVAYVLGIAHPPGYAFMTLAGKLFQTIIPFGSIPWRSHLLSATSATVAALAVFGAVRALAATEAPSVRRSAAIVAALFAALSLGTATDFWQHAIHANPHIITATFLAVNLFLLTMWWARGRSAAAAETGATTGDRWLYAFCVSAGLGVTHHPLTVFSFPAYAFFILAARPRIVRQGRTLLKMIAFALLGLSVWLYFPLRSPMQPVFGPDDMNTLSGFLDHVLARGLTESLPFFGLVDQPQRALVFWSLLRLQYALTTLFLALLGLIWLWRRPRWPLGLLYSGALLSNYLFVINLRAQDIMAYLLGPFLVIGLLAGVGLLALFHLLQQRVRAQPAALALLAAALFLLGPVLQTTRNLPRISLRDYDDGTSYVNHVFDYFEGRGEGVVLLNDWEHMTPLWYTRFVEGRWPDPEDVRPEFVSTERTWLENAFAYLPGGPVYLDGYRSEITAAGFRLRPRGPFYQVVEPGDGSVPPELMPVDAAAGEINVVGYQSPAGSVRAGDYLSLTLAMTAPVTPTHYYVPALQVGEGDAALDYTFTTDQHLLTPLWQPGEVIVERFDFALPLDLPGGTYPLLLRMKDLSEDTLTPLALPLGTLEVEGQAHPPATTGLLANFRQRVALSGARLWHGLEMRSAPWSDPLVLSPGDTVNLVLNWRSLAPAEESYTVFVHLIDAANRPLLTLDYTPLGGAAPTYLWIPKWLPGQQYLDPYRLTIPATLPADTYYVEVGLYEMTSGRRLHIADAAGNLAGDRYILGPLKVEGPSP